MRQQEGDKSVSHRAVFVEPLSPDGGDEGHIWVKMSRAPVEQQLAARPERGSTIREGGDTTTSSPGRSSKQPLPGMRLHDPLHRR